MFTLKPAPSSTRPETRAPSERLRCSGQREGGQTLPWSAHNGTDGDASGPGDRPCPRQTTFLGLSLPTQALKSQGHLLHKTNAFCNFVPSTSWFPYEVGHRWPCDAVTPAVPTPVGSCPASPTAPRGADVTDGRAASAGQRPGPHGRGEPCLGTGGRRPQLGTSHAQTLMGTRRGRSDS